MNSFDHAVSNFLAHTISITHNEGYGVNYRKRQETGPFCHGYQLDIY